MYDAHGRRINLIEKATPATNREGLISTSTGTNFRPKIGNQMNNNVNIKFETQQGTILAGSKSTIGEFFSLGAAQHMNNALPAKSGLKVDVESRQQQRLQSKESAVTVGGSSSSTATAGFYGPSSGSKDRNAAANDCATGNTSTSKASNRRQKGAYTYDVQRNFRKTTRGGGGNRHAMVTNTSTGYNHHNAQESERSAQANVHKSMVRFGVQGLQFNAMDYANNPDSSAMRHWKSL